MRGAEQHPDKQPAATEEATAVTEVATSETVEATAETGKATAATEEEAMEMEIPEHIRTCLVRKKVENETKFDENS